MARPGDPPPAHRSGSDALCKARTPPLESPRGHDGLYLPMNSTPGVAIGAGSPKCPHPHCSEPISERSRSSGSNRLIVMSSGLRSLGPVSVSDHDLSGLALSQYAHLSVLQVAVPKCLCRNTRVFLGQRDHVDMPCQLECPTRCLFGVRSSQGPKSCESPQTRGGRL